MGDAAAEFAAIQTVHTALEPLDDQARSRVLTYVVNLLRIDVSVVKARAVSAKTGDTQGADVDQATKQPRVFGSFAELYAAANPTSNGERALVAGYWLQVSQGKESFAAAAAQKELTHLGHKIANITDAIDAMKSRTPMLMLQVKKSGSSRQARKLYQVSHEGVKRVEEMADG